MKNYTGRSSSPLEKIWIFLHASGYISLKFFPSSLVSSQHHTLYIDKLWPAALKNIISTYLLSPESNIVEGLFKTDHGKPILMLHFFVLCFQNSKYWKSSMLFKVSYDCFVGGLVLLEENHALCFECLSFRRSSFTFSSTLCNNRFAAWVVLERNAISSAKLLYVSGTSKYCFLCLFVILIPVVKLSLLQFSKHDLVL